MSLEGLRAWIGEVERKLGMRTRVFLVLSVLALGGAGAAVYLAIDARDSSVSESDVQALQEDLEGQIGSGGTSGAEIAELEAELNALKAEVEALGGKGSSNDSQKGNGGDSGAGGGVSSGPSDEQPPAKPSGGTKGGGDDGPSLEELLEQTQEENAQAEREQDGK